jgi:hypothetical protein
MQCDWCGDEVTGDTTLCVACSAVPTLAWLTSSDDACLVRWAHHAEIPGTPYSVEVAHWGEDGWVVLLLDRPLAEVSVAGTLELVRGFLTPEHAKQHAALRALSYGALL